MSHCVNCLAGVTREQFQHPYCGLWLHKVYENFNKLVRSGVIMSTAGLESRDKGSMSQIVEGMFKDISPSLCFLNMTDALDL